MSELDDAVDWRPVSEVPDDDVYVVLMTSKSGNLIAGDVVSLARNRSTYTPHDSWYTHHDLESRPWADAAKNYIAWTDHIPGPSETGE